MTSADRWVDRYLRRVRFGQFLQRAAEWLAAYLFVFGAMVLVAKLLLPTLWPHVLWLALCVVPVLVGGWLVARRHPFTRAESVALLDQKLDAGGLLMTLTEAPDAEWAERLPQLESQWLSSLPRFRPVRFARYLALPALFALGARLVPLREAQTAPVVRNAVGVQASQELEELLTALDEAEVLEEEEEKELREEIEKLAEETKRTPLTHEKWETVDALRERLRMRLDVSSASVAKASQAAGLLARAALADGLALDPERAAQLEQDIADALQSMTGAPGKAGASKLLERLAKNGKLSLSSDPAEREQQLRDLQDLLEREAKKLEELRKQCAACQSGQCQACGQGNCAGGACTGTTPGRGGVTRGRGDAALSWGDESDAANTKFKATVLPPGALDDPKDEVAGISMSAPTVEPADSAPRSESATSGPAAGNETWNRTLRPRHRQVVREYFESK